MSRPSIRVGSWVTVRDPDHPSIHVTGQVWAWQDAAHTRVWIATGSTYISARLYECRAVTFPTNNQETLL